MSRQKGSKEHPIPQHKTAFNFLVFIIIVTSVMALLSTHVQGCYSNNTYQTAGISPYTESTKCTSKSSVSKLDAPCRQSAA